MQKKLREMAEEEFIEHYEKYTEDVMSNGFLEMPSKTNFASYMNVPKKDVIYWYKQHPQAQDVLNQMTADVIIEGMAKKKYQASSGAFALKNWCKWTDSPKQESSGADNTKTLMSEKEAKERLKAFNAEQEGLIRFKKAD